MRHIPAIAIFLISSLLLSGCNSASQVESVESQAWQMIDRGALILDVRTEGEFKQGHLANAILIPHNELSMRIAEIDTDKERLIVIYCRSGGRASRAESILREHGFKNVLNGGGYTPLMQFRAM